MGTNYYWYGKKDCKCCGRNDEGIHIGKSSYGWCFSLHMDDELKIHDLKDWVKVWEKGIIKSEYNEKITPKKMFKIITQRKSDSDFKKPMPDSYFYLGKSWDDFFRENNAQPGPNGLLRHQISAHCHNHGDGTWDLCNGDFC